MKRRNNSVLESQDGFFSKITEKERDEVRKWLKYQEFHTRHERDFAKVLKEALEEVDYNYWISNIEPSVDKKNCKLIFAENKPVAWGYNIIQLHKMCEEYNPKRGSRMADLYELFIWYAYRIVKGYWTLDFVTNSRKVNRWKKKTATNICGGFKDGCGNSYKIVNHEGIFVGVGGSYDFSGELCPIAYVYNCFMLHEIHRKGTCVVVLTK